MKIALITFHAPYNYGSCLQAYALQEKIKDLGHDVDIINYRFDGQKKAYRLIRNNGNAADLIKDLLQIPVFRKKKKRAQMFENFIADNMNLTMEYQDPAQLSNIAYDYDIFVSGSDQIWNKHANELDKEDWKFMHPYLLTFTNKKKISYASSIGGTTNEEIMQNMAPSIRKFSFLSAREKQVADRLAMLLKVPVDNVLDPTLLLNKDDYINRFDIEENPKEKYIFYYSLAGISTVKKHLDWIDGININNYKVIINTPYAWFPDHGTHKSIVAIGPIEFLRILNNAECIITDSYHGTLFSVNFEKNFLTLCKSDAKSDYRKNDILGKLGLANHMVNEFTNGFDTSVAINNGEYCDHLNELRNRSIEYLKNALQ